MFAAILYGDQETLLVNPSCSIVNLLESIKSRSGYGNSNCALDLTDQTGLVLELSRHNNEYASKYLTTQGPYILVEKQSTSLQPKNDTSDSPSPPQVCYIPLLECCTERFPNYHPRVATKGQTQGPPSPTRTKSKKLKKGKKSVSDKRDLVSPNM